MVFVPLARLLVKFATAVQVVLSRPHRNSGTALQSLVPVDLTVIKSATLIKTILTVGGDGGVTMLSRPFILE